MSRSDKGDTKHRESGRQVAVSTKDCKADGMSIAFTSEIGTVYRHLKQTERSQNEEIFI